MVTVYISNGVAAAGAVGTRRGLWTDDSICPAKLKRSVKNYVAEGLKDCVLVCMRDITCPRMKELLDSFESL